MIKALLTLLSVETVAFVGYWTASARKALTRGGAAASHDIFAKAACLRGPANRCNDSGPRVRRTPRQPSQWGYDSLWYRAGYIFELPFQHKGNMTHHVGVTFNGEGRVRMEWRVSLGTLRRRGRDSFGIRSTDPNPFL